MSSYSSTPLDQLVTRSRLSWPWFVTIVALVLIGLPFLIAYLEGVLEVFLDGGAWRNLLTSPVIIIYILILHRPLENQHRRSLAALRSVVLIDDQAFDRLVREASNVDNRAEVAAFGAGALLGFLVTSPWEIPGDFSGLRLYYLVTSTIMWGLLSWLSFVSVASTRLHSALHRQPLKIDIFDLRPFEPIGRHSLYVALAFVGGSVISVLLINPLSAGIEIAYLVLYGILAAVAVLVFFLGMRPTHNVLAKTKRDELKAAERGIAGSFQDLKTLKAEGGDVTAISTELNLWLKYEERLKKSRTWPYNTAMIRTLFFSVFLPAIASLIQRYLTSILMK